MIGLGVSSISDSWYSFAQNTKSLEEYYEILESDKLPVVKGHILTDEDLIIRKHILNLTCELETSWTAESLNFTELPEVLMALKEIENDNLIVIEDQKIKITEEGRPFVRNICMAFDLHLKRKSPETNLFSMTV
ncbi:Oxygen-independent coproporphyrinogen-III oxidase [compost metagenome]